MTGEQGEPSSLGDKLKTTPEARVITRSPVHEDHDYVCCRGSKAAAATKDQRRRTNTGDHGAAKTGLREVNTFLKVGHDSRRKLCIVGFNWNSSQFRLNRLNATKSDISTKSDINSSSHPVNDARLKQPKDKSARSKVVLTSRKSTSGAEITTPTISGTSYDRPEVVRGTAGEQAGSGGAKRRSKVYVYKPPSAAISANADRVSIHSPAAKRPALVSKSAARKTETGSSSMSAVEETTAAVESILSVSRHDLRATSAAAPLQQKAGDYTIHLSTATGASSKTTTEDYDCLSSRQRETGSGSCRGCEAVVSLTQIVEGGTSSSSTTVPLGIPSPFLLQTGLEQALGIAAFHPMSPSTSSSTTSRVAADDCDLTATPGTDPDRCTLQSTPETWFRAADTHGGRAGSYMGSGDVEATGPSYSAEPLLYDDRFGPFSDSGDVRYASSSFLVCDDNWDSYQREEQIDDGWCQQTAPFTSSFGGRKAATSRFRFTDTGIITSFGDGRLGYGRSAGRGDRRRRKTDGKRNSKLETGADGDFVAAAVNGSCDNPKVVSTSKCCRQRTSGEGSRRSRTDDITADVAQLETVEKNRRRKSVTSRRNCVTVGEDGVTTTVEGSSKRRTQSLTSRRQPRDASLKTTTESVRSAYLVDHPIVGGSAVPPPFTLDNPALCGSHPLVTQ